jgi:hypothetical protein
MMPWERDIYVDKLVEHIKEENKKIEEQNRKYRLESLYREKEAILNEKVLTRKWKYEDDERKILSQYKLDINTKQSALEADLSQNR